MPKKNKLELYTKDCGLIERLHGICQTANLIVMILEIISVIGMIAAEVFDEELFILIPVIIAVSILLYMLNKLIINVCFGMLYDIRVTRMNTTAPVNQENQEA